MRFKECRFQGINYKFSVKILKSKVEPQIESLESFCKLQL